MNMPSVSKSTAPTAVHYCSAFCLLYSYLHREQHKCPLDKIHLIKAPGKQPLDKSPSKAKALWTKAPIGENPSRTKTPGKKPPEQKPPLD